MKNMLAAIFLTALIAVGCNPAGKTVRKIILCGDDKLQIIKVPPRDSTDYQVVWEWHSAEGESTWGPSFTRRLRTLDDCKVVGDGKQVLVTSSGGGVFLLDIASRKPLFYTEAPNAHSADILPGGRILVALSSHPEGSSLELYDIQQPGKCLWRDSLTAAHGAVWMKEKERLYALGSILSPNGNKSVIRAYRLKDWDSPHPSLEETDRWSDLPSGGHDLTRINAGELIFSGSRGVYVIDATDGKIRPFEPLHNTRDIKSVNYIEKSKQLVYTKGEIRWWTHHVYSENPAWKLNVDSIHVYKVRIFE